MYIYISSYVYIYICIYKPHIYIYIYVYIYTHSLYIPYITWETPCLDLILPPAPRHGLHRGRESGAGFCGAKEQRRLGISGGQTPKDG